MSSLSTGNGILGCRLTGYLELKTSDYSGTNAIWQVGLKSLGESAVGIFGLPTLPNSLLNIDCGFGELAFSCIILA